MTVREAREMLLGLCAAEACPVCGRLRDPSPDEEVKTLGCSRLLGGCGRSLPTGDVRKECEARLARRKEPRP